MLKNYLVTHLETGESDMHVGYSPSEIITGTHQEEWDDQTPVRMWNPDRDVYSVVGMMRKTEEPKKWITCQVTGEPGDLRIGGGY
jgi:hypothetical protein